MGGLFEDGVQALAAVDAYIKRSEERLAYRQKTGRGLSKAHQRQLRELAERLDALRQRLDALLEPVPDVEELRRRFQALAARIGKGDENNGPGPGQ